MANCRFCRTDVDDRARRCPHCHADHSFFGRFRPIVTAVAALGGMGYGVYEQFEASHSKAEMKQEQAALAKVLDSVPEENIPEKYKTDKSESQLAAEVKKNPKNTDARIKLHVLRRRHRFNRGQKTPGQTPQAKTNVAKRPIKRTAYTPRGGGPKRERTSTAGNTRPRSFSRE